MKPFTIKSAHRLATGLRLRVQVRASSTFTTDRFLDEVAFVQPPPNLGPFLKVLAAQGMELTAPTNRVDLMPLIVPVAQHGTEIVGFLRWPTPRDHPRFELPIVSTSRGSPSVRFLARSVDEYITRALVEEDAQQGSEGAGPISQVLGDLGSALYTKGDFDKSNLKRVDAYLTRRVGPFPDVLEGLAKVHLAKGTDNGLTSALVAGDFYMKNNHFPGIARPYEFCAGMLADAKRVEEARDVARVALRLPWWSLESFEKCKAVALLKGDAASIVYQMSEEAMAQSAAARQSRVPSEPKGPVQLALEEAQFAMNQVSAGEATWEDVRSKIAKNYRIAGLDRVANLVEFKQ